MWRIFHRLFGWHYVEYRDNSTSFIARVKVNPNGSRRMVTSSGVYDANLAPEFRLHGTTGTWRPLTWEESSCASHRSRQPKYIQDRSQMKIMCLIGQHDLTSYAEVAGFKEFKPLVAHFKGLDLGLDIMDIFEECTALRCIHCDYKYKGTTPNDKALLTRENSDGKNNNKALLTRENSDDKA